jgi:PAS domain S-box-containing protein
MAPSDRAPITPPAAIGGGTAPELSGDLLDRAVAASPDAVVVSRGGLVEWCAGDVAGVVGHAPEHLIGRAMSDLLHPGEDLSRLTDGDPARQCVQVRHRDGSSHWVDIRLARLGDPGSQDLVVGSWRLVDHEMELLEAIESDRLALVDRARHFRHVAESTADAVTVTAAGHLQWASPGLGRLTGLDARRMLGRPLLDLLHPDDRDTIHATHERIPTRPKDARPMQVRIGHADGSWRWVELRDAPLLDVSGSVTGIVTGWRLVDDEVAFLDALARSEASSRERAAQLQHALDSRVVVEQAKGMVAAQRGMTPDEAFEVIRGYGRRHHRRVPDVAHDVVRLGLQP